MKYLLLSISLFLALTNFAHAANFLTLKYSAKAGDSLKSILIYFFKEGVKPYDANESLTITMQKNPEVKQWNPLAKDVIFKLYLDPKITDLKKYREYFVKNKEADTHHLMLSTNPSIGFFSQSNKDGFVVKYNQISLMNLGMTYSYTPFVSPYHFSAGFHYSSISSTSNQISTGASSEVDIPAEYGISIYGIYAKREKAFQFYGGLDYENFSSFNLKNILDGGGISIDSNTIYYLTAGAKYRFRSMDKIVLNLSISKSVMSKAEPGLASSVPAELSGLKYLLELGYNINDKWSVDAAYRGSNLSGDNDLSVNRVSLGVNYLIF